MKPRLRLPRIERATWLRWRGRVAVGAVALGVVALLAWALTPARELVEVAAARRGDVIVEVVEDGETRLEEAYVVSAPTQGTLRRVELEVGDFVSEGQVVAVLEPAAAALLDPRAEAEARARLAQALDAEAQLRAEFEATRIELETMRPDVGRTAALVEAGALARRELERVRGDVAALEERLAAARHLADRASHEVEAARAALRPPPTGGPPLELRSPVSGRVIERFEESEGFVTAGTPLLELGDPVRLEVVVDVLSVDAVRILSGADARIEAWGGPAPLPGAVERVEPTAETVISALGVEEQRVDVIVDLLVEPSQYAGLGEGYRVEARIVTDRAFDVVVVPEAALFRRGDGFATFRVIRRRARLTPVRIGLRNGSVAEVIEGLEPGDLVVLHPTGSIEDGTRVKTP